MLIMPALCIQVLDIVKPEGIEVFGYLGLVRNSVGSGKASSHPCAVIATVFHSGCAY